ncbi:MAG: PEP-CTERM sorting domain-containing protein [Acidobacteria bacterium]|nr:PEP-CTERM sorting domain-containing protein [Acidobacteriota bacterium]
MAVVGLGLPTAWADLTTLQEITFNVNGVTTDFGGPVFVLPGLTNGFNANGLGTLTFTFNPGVGGSYFFDLFVDYQLHVPFFNEYGAAIGVPSAGMTWQIDEPGLGADLNRFGTIFANHAANAFDNTNHVPGTKSNFLNNCGANGGGPVDPTCNNDVSMGMGFNFVLAANQLAVITLTTSHVAPLSGFYLQQTQTDDLTTPANLYLQGGISIQQTGVPEPSSLLMLGTLLIGVSVWRRRSLTR